MNAKQRKALTARIEETCFILAITNPKETALYNFNWGFQSAILVAAEIAGLPMSEIDAAKERGERRGEYHTHPVIL